MRFTLSIVAIAAALLITTAATATITFTVVGTNLTTGATTLSGPGGALPGDQVQIDIFMVSDVSVAGATFSASLQQGAALGVPGAALEFISGSSSALWFSENQNEFGAPIDGLENTLTSSSDPAVVYNSFALPRTLGSSDFINGALSFFRGVTFGGSWSGTGIFDLGIRTGSVGPGGTPDVDYVLNGAAHARLIFTLIADLTILDIGLGPNDGVVESPSPGGLGTIVGASVVIGQTPEPGTSLLLGLGLGALSMAGRRCG